MRTMIASGGLLILALLAAGCAASTSRRPLDAEAVRLLKSDAQLPIVTERGSALVVSSAASSVVNALPIIGIANATADIVRGGNWTKAYRIEDPAWSVKRLLTTRIPDELGFIEPRDVGTVLTDSTADVLRTSLGEAHAVVLQTLHWRLAKGTGWAPEIALSYQVTARLVRVPDASVLWSGACDVRTAPASMDRWEESDGALLRAEHDKAAKACGRQLLRQFADAIRAASTARGEK